MSLPDTATDIATAVRSQSVSAVSVVEDCLDRISNLNETLNCFTRRLDELALAQANNWMPRLLAANRSVPSRAFRSG